MKKFFIMAAIVGVALAGCSKKNGNGGDDNGSGKDYISDVKGARYVYVDEASSAVLMFTLKFANQTSSSNMATSGNGVATRETFEKSTKKHVAGSTFNVNFTYEVEPNGSTSLVKIKWATGLSGNEAIVKSNFASVIGQAASGDFDNSLANATNLVANVSFIFKP